MRGEDDLNSASGVAPRRQEPVAVLPERSDVGGQEPPARRAWWMAPLPYPLRAISFRCRMFTDNWATRMPHCPLRIATDYRLTRAKLPGLRTYMAGGECACSRPCRWPSIAAARPSLGDYATGAPSCRRPLARWKLACRMPTMTVCRTLQTVPQSRQDGRRASPAARRRSPLGKPCPLSLFLTGCGRRPTDSKPRARTHRRMASSRPSGGDCTHSRGQRADRSAGAVLYRQRPLSDIDGQSTMTPMSRVRDRADSTSQAVLGSDLAPKSQEIGLQIARKMPLDRGRAMCRIGWWRAAAPTL